MRALPTSLHIFTFPAAFVCMPIFQRGWHSPGKAPEHLNYNRYYEGNNFSNLKGPGGLRQKGEVAVVLIQLRWDHTQIMKIFDLNKRRQSRKFVGWFHNEKTVWIQIPWWLHCADSHLLVFKMSDLLLENIEFPISCLHSVRAELKFTGSGTADHESILQYFFWKDLANSTLTPEFSSCLRDRSKASTVFRNSCGKKNYKNVYSTLNGRSSVSWEQLNHVLWVPFQFCLNISAPLSLLTVSILTNKLVFSPPII